MGLDRVPLLHQQYPSEDICHADNVPRMGITDRLRRLDERVGVDVGPRDGESRRDYLARLSSKRMLAYENPFLYREVVELHDRVTSLEARLAALEGRAPSDGG